MANPVKIPGVVTSIQKHDEGVYTITISPEIRVPRFKAGQFLHLAIDEYDPHGGYWPESRVFSIASAPSSQTIEIVYSVKGRYTSRMSREIFTGKKVWLKLPYGNFSIETATDPCQDIVLIAGGTGISPFASYLRSISENQAAVGRRVHLFYGIRKPEHLLFSDLIYSCCTTLDKFSLELFVENGMLADMPGVLQKQGMIMLDRIIVQGKTMVSPAFFLSGPPSMITTFKNGLLEAGIGPNNIKIDEWE